MQQKNRQTKKNTTTRKVPERTVNYLLLGIIAVMLIFGLVELYSASSVVSYAISKTSTYYFSHQLIYGTLIGLVAMYITSKIPYKTWQTYTPYLVMAVIGLLVVVLVPGIGVKVAGSRRWIGRGAISMQPAEIAKLILVFYIASWIEKRNHQIKDFYYGIVPTLIIIAVFAGLIILEPDIGTMLVVTITALIMLFVGGIQWKHLAWIIGGGLLAFGVLVKVEPYRIARFTAFLNPAADPQGIGYQVNQALVAAGSGGWWGFGYGHSRQKYNYLPEVIGDSIFAVIVEELGFIRGTFVIFLYMIFAFQGLRIAKGVEDTFGRMVAVGIITWISVQALINIGAIIGLLPLTGIPLPFVSYGSSSLIVSLAAMGILLNISKQSTI